MYPLKHLSVIVWESVPGAKSCGQPGENRRLRFIVMSFQDILYRFYQANTIVYVIYTPLG